MRTTPRGARPVTGTPRLCVLSHMTRTSVLSCATELRSVAIHYLSPLARATWGALIGLPFHRVT